MNTPNVRKRKLFRLDVGKMLRDKNNLLKTVVDDHNKAEMLKPIEERNLIKNSVFHTLKVALNKAIKNVGEKWHTAPPKLWFDTFAGSLAKLTKNSERTTRRHIEKLLLELGLLKAKERLSHGLRLTFATLLVAYDEKEEIVQQAPPEEAKAKLQGLAWSGKKRTGDTNSLNSLLDGLGLKMASGAL